MHEPCGATQPARRAIFCAVALFAFACLFGCDWGDGVAPPSAASVAEEEETGARAPSLAPRVVPTPNARDQILRATAEQPLREQPLVLAAVYDALGTPVVGVKVDFSATQEGRVLHFAYTDRDGCAAVTAPQGVGFVRACHQDVGRSLAVEVHADGQYARLMLGRPASMTAVVRDVRGRPAVGQRVRFVDVAHRRFHHCSVASPRIATTDGAGRIHFEALTGSRIRIGDDIRQEFVAHDGDEVVAKMPAIFDPGERVFDWYCGLDRSASLFEMDRKVSLPETSSEPFWLEVLMPGGVAAPRAGLHWIDSEIKTPTQFYAQTREGHRFMMHANKVKRSPVQLLVRGRDGYSQTLTLQPGLLPRSTAVVLQPPGDIEIQVLHRGRRARGVHTELTSWGKLADAQLDGEGIARYTMVHHGPMNVRVMRGPEVLAVRQVHVPPAGTARAIVHVDLSR